jgi:non-heme chloroperoxidase
MMNSQPMIAPVVPLTPSKASMMNTVKLYIKDSGGDGTPVVMIHGFPLSHEAFEKQFDSLKQSGLRPIAYDRRGFGSSEKPAGGYDYDTLSDDLLNVLMQLELKKAVLLGFSMGGGEVARFVGRHGQDRLLGVIFAAAVTPFLAKTTDNPNGPLEQAKAREKLESLKKNREDYFEKFVSKFYEVEGDVVVDQSEIDKAVSLCKQSDDTAAIECMRAFSTTDFRQDLNKITIPTLVIHGDSDAVVPFEGSGKLTHSSIGQSELELIEGGPHGINVSHADLFNQRVIAFIQAAAKV